MRAVITELTGELWGQHISDAGEITGEVIRVSPASAPDGPAENAFVYVELNSERHARGRYISWINYYDIEHAARQQAGRWKTVEPSQACVRRIEWHPYGWGGALLPSVAY